MAVPSNAENQKISAHVLFPGRSSAIANKSNGVQSVVETLDLDAKSTVGDVIHRRNKYVLTKPPAADIIPNPKIGDKAEVFMVDDTQPLNPYEYREYHYVSFVDGWKQVAYLS